VPDRTAKSLVGFAREAIAPGTDITTDDWQGYDTLPKYGFQHRAIAERGDPSVAEEWLPLIHLVFSNLKSWLLGIHHGVSTTAHLVLPDNGVSGTIWRPDFVPGDTWQ